MPTTSPSLPHARVPLVPGGSATGSPAGSRLPGPVRERRPVLTALGLVLVVAGALGSALVVHRTGERVDVLVARHDIAPGQLVTAADLRTARVAADGAAVVPAGALGGFVGTHATTRIPADTLVNRTMFLAGGTVPTGAAVVGVVVRPEQRPTAPLVAGDVVRAYLVAADGVSTVSGQPAGTVLLDAARVVGGGMSGDPAPGAPDVTATSSAGDVSLLVPETDAASVVAAAAAGQVALVRLAGASVPSVDLAGS
ncbi:SAF domain-containing protein [Kineococcus sp. TBRC 1896]|uniref:SAF domain-containing protein n=1 Tax=Kineococcus mangrovi TaxID=1660183 RepID=A0ABV4I2V0_9ACTN